MAQEKDPPKSYQDFTYAFKAAHSDLKGESCQELCKAEWREVGVKLEIGEEMSLREKVGNSRGIVIRREDSLFAKPTKWKTGHVSTGKISVNKAKCTATASEHSYEAKVVEDIPKDIPSQILAEYLKPAQ